MQSPVESMAPAHDDEVIWQRVLGGDGDAFGQLYQRHGRAVYNHCFRRTASWSLAEDMTSVVFLEAWRRRDAVQLSERSLLPWLLGIANNVVLKQRRTLVRHHRAMARLPASVVEPDPADDVASRLDDEHRMRQVRIAMRTLTRVEQETVALCVWAGLSYADAAIAMGVPIGTVRSRLARARERLRSESTEQTENRGTQETA